MRARAGGPFASADSRLASEHGGRAVRHLRRVAGGVTAVLLERRLQRREPFEGGLGADSLVGGDRRAVHADRDDLAVEPAFGRRARRALLRAKRERVALLARDPHVSAISSALSPCGIRS